MKNKEYENLPYMLYSDSEGRIYEHPYYRMAGFSGNLIINIAEDDIIRMPEFSKLFYIPDCPPIGFDPETGDHKTMRTVDHIEGDGRCFAVSAFLEPGFVRTHLPAVDYELKSYTLPMWSYTSVGFRDDSYWVTGFRIEYNHRWDPKNYDDRKLPSAIKDFEGVGKDGPLVRHLKNCAENNHCFAAKNLFLGRWEAPLPVSRTCNSNCLGCLSFQPKDSCEASHQRISFRPDRSEIVEIALDHLNKATDAIISFGQGCEGEPLTEYRLIADSIKEIRNRTEKGTINLNTNGSWPERIREIAQSGLDSIRISLNSARPAFYNAYYRPKNYTFVDVVRSISLSKELGLYTMVNYLVFPGITDQVDEIEALKTIIRETGINFLHFKNLSIDPQLYLNKMPVNSSEAVGMKQMAEIIKNEFPDIQLGYFNQPVR